MSPFAKLEEARANNIRIDGLYSKNQVTYKEALSGILVAYRLDGGAWTLVKPRVLLEGEGFELAAGFSTRYAKPSDAVRAFLHQNFPAEMQDGRLYL